MKIIESGNKNWSKVFKCKKCHAKLEVEKSDLYQIPNTWDHNFPYDVAFTCPECYTQNVINYDGPCIEDIPILLSKTIKSEQTLFKYICSWFK